MSIEKMRNLEELARNLHRCADMGDEYSFQYYLDQINKAYKPTYPEMGTRYEHGTYRGYEHREPVRVEHHHYHGCDCKRRTDERFKEVNGMTREEYNRIQIAVYDHY